MKTREIQELKNKPAGELQRLMQEGNDRLQTLRFDLAAGKVKNVGELRELKKKVARIQTFLKQGTAK